MQRMCIRWGGVQVVVATAQFQLCSIFQKGPQLHLYLDLIVWSGVDWALRRVLPRAIILFA